MLNKLRDGFIYGLGFSLAIFLVGWLYTTYQLSSINNAKIITHHDGGTLYEEKAEWRKLPISKKIPKLTGAVLLRFKEEDNKLMAAYVESVFTKDSAVKLPLNIGDRVEESDFYSKGGYSTDRDGILLMYVDIPPKEMEGAYLYESRLIAHGDMPLELFLKKFEGEN